MTDRLLVFLADTPESYGGSLEAVWNFFKTGGWFMIPIVICSLVAVGVIIFKFVDLARGNVIPAHLEGVLENAEDLAANGRLSEVERVLRTQDSPMTRIGKAALLVRHATKEDAARSTESMAREEVSHLERGIPALEVIFTIAPLLGLIGTVSGLVTIFATFGNKVQTAGQSALIAKGISEALNATIAGLAVAIPAYIFQSYFTRRVEKLALRMGTLATGLLNAVYREPAPEPSPRPKREAKAALAE